MDINDFRGITTLLVMITFISICVWAYSSKRKARFEEAANLPFADDDDTKSNNYAQEKTQS